MYFLGVNLKGKILTTESQYSGDLDLKEKICSPSLQVASLPDEIWLTLKVPIMTAADDIHKYFFIIFQRKKKDLMSQVNPLLGFT